jgi:hypothetical protein
MHAIDLES